MVDYTDDDFMRNFGAPSQAPNYMPQAGASGFYMTPDAGQVPPDVTPKTKPRGPTLGGLSPADTAAHKAHINYMRQLYSPLMSKETGGLSNAGRLLAFLAPIGDALHIASAKKAGPNYSAKAAAALKGTVGKDKAWNRRLQLMLAQGALGDYKTRMDRSHQARLKQQRFDQALKMFGGGQSQNTISKGQIAPGAETREPEPTNKPSSPMTDDDVALRKRLLLPHVWNYSQTGKGIDKIAKTELDFRKYLLDRQKAEKTGQPKDFSVFEKALKDGSFSGTYLDWIKEKASKSSEGREQGKTKAAFKSDLPTAKENVYNTLSVIRGMMSHPAKSRSLGLGAYATNVTPEAHGFQAYIDQIKGKAFLEAFQSLKGGGHITEIEGQKATEAMARLSVYQGEKDFDRAIEELEAVLLRGLRRAYRKAGVKLPQDWDKVPMNWGDPKKASERVSDGWSIKRN